MEVTPSGDAPPPAELPLVDIPPTNFGEIGAQLVKAATDSNWWESLLDGLAKRIKNFVGMFFGAGLSLVLWFLGKMGSLFFKIQEQAGNGYAYMASTAVGGLFGIEVPEASFTQVVGGAPRKDVANAVGQVVLNALFGDYMGGSKESLTPSAKSAERYMGVVSNLAIEGWFLGWLVEVLGAGQIEKFADLKDITSDVYGLSRLTRRVLKAPVDILIEQPFTWLLNEKYRPTLLSAAHCAHALGRGLLTEDQVRTELARQGWSDDRIKVLISNERKDKHLTVGELGFLTGRAFYTKGQAIDELKAAGWSDEKADLLLTMADFQVLDGLWRQFVDVAETHFVNRDIELDQWLGLLDRAPLPPKESDLRRQLAGLKREFHRKYLTTSEIVDCMARGILGREDLRESLLRQGYTFEDATHLELLLVDKVQDAAEAAAARERAAKARDEKAVLAAEKLAREKAQAEALAAAGGVTLAQERTLTLKGIRTVSEYSQMLAALGLSPDAVADLTTELQQEIAKAAADAKDRAAAKAAAATKQIDVGQAEKAVLAGVSTLDDYRRLLEGRNFDPGSIDVLVGTLGKQLADQQAAAARRAAADAKLKTQQVSLAQLERGVRLGLLTLDQYGAALTTRGFTAGDVALLSGELTAELDADQAARAKRAAVEAALAAKKISLAEWEKAVRAGVRSMADFQVQLAAEGFGTDDQDLIVRLVQLDMARDQAAADARAAAKAKASTKEITLAQLERAVLLGVVPLELYDASLQAAGYSAADRGILTLTLAAQLRRQAAAQAVRERAGAQLATRGLSEAQLEKALRAGSLTPDGFVGRLMGEGFSQDDAGLLLYLVQLEQQQAADAAARRKQIQAELRKKGVSLAQYEQAVLKGLRTMDDFQAFLAGEGYQPPDVLLLAELLELRVEAAAAKNQPAPAA